MNDEGHFGHGGAQTFEGRDALAVGKVEVHQDDVELADAQQVQAVGETGSDGEVDVDQNFGSQLPMEQSGIARIVFEDQDFRPSVRFSQRLFLIHGSGLPCRGNFRLLLSYRPIRAGWPEYLAGNLGPKVERILAHKRPGTDQSVPRPAFGRVNT